MDWVEFGFGWKFAEREFVLVVLVVVVDVCGNLGGGGRLITRKIDCGA